MIEQIKKGAETLLDDEDAMLEALYNGISKVLSRLRDTAEAIFTDVEDDSHLTA